MASSQAPVNSYDDLVHRIDPMQPANRRGTGESLHSGSDRLSQTSLRRLSHQSADAFDHNFGLLWNNSGQEDTENRRGSLQRLSSTSGYSAIKTEALLGAIGEEVPALHELQGVLGSTWNLLNDIIGAPIVTVPYFVAVCGWSLGFGLLWVQAAFSLVTLVLQHQLADGAAGAADVSADGAPGCVWIGRVCWHETRRGAPHV